MIKKSRTSPPHPKSNGKSEIFSRTSVNLLRSLSDKEKKQWPSHLNMLTVCYNSTFFSSTRFTPYLLFFGKSLILPMDGIICSTIDTISDNIDQYVKHQNDQLLAFFMFLLSKQVINIYTGRVNMKGEVFLN